MLAKLRWQMDDGSPVGTAPDGWTILGRIGAVDDNKATPDGEVFARTWPS
jgi:hypothetical protein